MTLETMIMLLWAQCPPYGCNRAATHMVLNGKLPLTVSLTQDQQTLWYTTHAHMVKAALELLDILAPVPAHLITTRARDNWRTLLRGGVAWRLLQTPGESDHVRMLNAMRGERRRRGESRIIKLHEQLATPRGHADATLVLLPELAKAHPHDFAARGMDRCAARLESLLPTLRKTTKSSQERRHGG